MPRYTATLEWTPSDEGRPLEEVVRQLEHTPRRRLTGVPDSP